MQDDAAAAGRAWFQHDRGRLLLLVVVLLVALVELLRTAWISDDAAITLRTVLNLLNGFGAGFNIDERVQAYTHPLWFLLVTALSAVTGSIFFSTFALGISLSLLVLWLVMVRVATGNAAALLAAAVLLLSKAYVDFSTSGLENPLSHLVLVAAFLLALRALDGADRRALTGFLLVCGLGYLSRPDLVLLLAPLALLVMYCWRRDLRTLAPALLFGALPVLAWTAFSIFYYGFPFPNTAYAKLGSGFGHQELLAQGWLYFGDSLQRDPLTLAVIAVGVVVGAWQGGIGRALAAGIVLHLMYVVSIGGDFMSGRFFTVPLLAAVLVLARAGLPAWPMRALTVAVVMAGLLHIDSTLMSGARHTAPVSTTTGITDERGFYFQNFGLLSRAGWRLELPEWRVGARDVMTLCGGMGFFALRAGPGIHVIDTCALADPLLARLPAVRQRRLRIGHFERVLPTDYLESVARNDNLVFDPVAREFYASIRTVTRASPGDPVRWREIWRLNTGALALPDPAPYEQGRIPRSSRTPTVSYAEVSADPSGMAAGVRFIEYLDVVLPSPRPLSALEVVLSGGAKFRVLVLRDGRYVPLLPHSLITRTLEPVRLSGRLPVTSEPVDRIRFQGVGADGRYTLKYLRLD